MRAQWVCIAAALTMAVSWACDRSPVGPTNTFPHLINACQIPVDATVRCSANLIDRIRLGSTEDVTTAATWSVDPADVAMFTAPGVLNPLRHGEATLSVTYERWTTEVLLTFLVDPSATARWLYFVQFTSVENDGQTQIPDVTIEVTHGSRAGGSCVTNTVGVCTIERFLTGEEFMGTASKAGYQPASFSYRVDPPVVNGNAPFYSVQLARVLP